jgi:hypothetical protein
VVWIQNHIPEIDFNTKSVTFKSTNSILVCIKWLQHLKCVCFNPHECDLDTVCGLNMHKCDFNTKSVTLKRMNLILINREWLHNTCSVILTLISAISMQKKWFTTEKVTCLSHECDFNPKTHFRVWSNKKSVILNCLRFISIRRE